jgi:hypothetical protein
MSFHVIMYYNYVPLPSLVPRLHFLLFVLFGRWSLRMRLLLYTYVLCYCIVSVIHESFNNPLGGGAWEWGYSYLCTMLLHCECDPWIQPWKLYTVTYIDMSFTLLQRFQNPCKLVCASCLLLVKEAANLFLVTQWRPVWLLTFCGLIALVHVVWSSVWGCFGGRL